jgi:hypothetical protein
MRFKILLPNRIVIAKQTPKFLKPSALSDRSLIIVPKVMAITGPYYKNYINYELLRKHYS